MKNFILISSALFVGIILFVVLLLKKTHNNNKIKNIIPSITTEEFDKRLEKAINFLQSKYDIKYIFRDPYLMCVEQVKDCESHWRVLMLAQNIVYGKYEEQLIQKLPNIFLRAKEIEESEYKKAKNKQLKDYPLEIYCNFSLGHPDNISFVKEIINSYSENLQGWIDINRYRTDWQWRKIWDESFCIGALASAYNTKTLLDSVLDNHYNILYQMLSRNVKNIGK